jgi:hypothetical protein
MFRRKNWPALVFITYGIFTYVPDWSSRFEFWREQSRQLGSWVAIMTAVIGNPLFGTFVIVVGVCYWIIVDRIESRRISKIIEHVVTSLAVVLVISVVGLAEAAVVASKLSPVRDLTPAQAKIISDESMLIAPHMKTPNGDPMSLSVQSIDTPEANEYASQIMSAFQKGGISVATTAPGMFAPIPMRVLDRGVKGVFITVKDEQNPTDGAKEFAKILNDAGIATYYRTSIGLIDWGFVVTIGLPGERDVAR